MIRCLVTGRLHDMPQARTSQSGNPFSTAKLRADSKDGATVWCSIIAFGELAERLAFPSTTWTTGIRDAKTARKMLEILEKHRWVFGIEGGMQLDGAHRKEVWKIVGKEAKP